MKIEHFKLLESGPTLGGFAVKPLHIEDSGVEESSDISGLLAASALNREFLLTVNIDGATKKFRVKAQSPRVAQEILKRRYATAQVVDVKELTGEGQESTQQKFEKHLKSHGYDVDERANYWTNKLKELEAQRQKYIAQGTLKADDVAPIAEEGELNVGIEAYGVRGASSKKWRKTFKNQAAFERWLDANEGDVEVLGTREVNLNDMFKEGAKGYAPGWMLRQDPALAKKVKDAKQGHKDLKKWAGKPVPKDVEEAIKLDAPQRVMPRDELQAYANRIKTGTKTKKDKFAPIIHGSNIKAITKTDSPDTAWDLDDLAAQITTRPRAILGTNAKMTKSATEGEIVYDLTLPALSGIVVDEETGDFVEITTCPGAGQCQLFCYARKGGYVMFPASSMSAAQALNFLVNDPDGYMAKVNQEITAIKKKTDKAGIQLVVRWHDAGDFFSKEYLNLAFDIARANPDVQFYAYTKMASVATGDKPENFIINFSSGAKRGEEKKVEFYKSQGNVVKQGVTVPKDMFFDLIAREGTKLIKDEKGRTQFKSPEALNQFKQRLAQQYKVDPNSIITYDQMLATPVGNDTKCNVIVQPGAGDRAANRKDVIDSYLMFH